MRNIDIVTPALISDFKDKIVGLLEKIKIGDEKPLIISSDQCCIILNLLICWLQEIEQDINVDLPESLVAIIKADFEYVYKNVNHLSIDDTISFLNSNICKFDSYRFFKSILSDEISCHVIVGANGSGKTMLANTISDALNKRNGIVIPAQKLLIIPTFSSTPSYDSQKKEYDEYQQKVLDNKRSYDANKSNDLPYDFVQQYGKEYRYVLGTLIAEQVKVSLAAREKLLQGKEVKKEDIKCKLDIAIEIWNDLICHKTIKYTESSKLIIEDEDGNIYSASKMSDGERVIFYLIGRVLLAPENGLIVVDEPELFLHNSIVNRLWNRLESNRRDCTFIYFTHNIQFAESRNANKYWIKAYKHPNNWEIKKITENQIPEPLLLQIIGSQKPILFCEGTKTSIDRKVYEAIFPQFYVRPVGSCIDVINYTKTFNKIKEANCKAYGIIDRDFKTEEELRKLKSENIYTYHAHEIENIFLTKDFIVKLANQLLVKGFNVDLYMNEIINEAKRNINLQASRYVSDLIKYYFTNVDFEQKKTLPDIKAQLSEIIKIDPQQLFNDRAKYLQELCNKKNFDEILLVYTDKGLISFANKHFSITKTQERAVTFLQDNSEAKDIIRRLFPAELAAI